MRFRARNFADAFAMRTAVFRTNAKGLACKGETNATPTCRDSSPSEVSRTSQVVPRQRAGTSLFRSCKRIHMKCQGAVNISGCLDSRSGRIHAAAIVCSNVSVSEVVPKSPETTPSRATFERLSAGMTGTISRPWLPKPMSVNCRRSRD